MNSGTHVENSLNAPAGKGFLIIAFLLLVQQHVADRWMAIQEFASRVVDDDQLVMWFGAALFRQGIFPEPYFFGQGYNPMIESLFAVPFVAAGIAFATALPLTTSLLALFPYFLIAVILFRGKKYAQSLLVLAVPLLLPPQFLMITGMPRGFVSGLFFGGIAASMLFTNVRWRFFLFGLTAALGFFCNPNCVMVVIPAGIVLFAANYRSPSFFIRVAAGAIPVLIIWYFAGQFYRQHPEHLVHPEWPLDFTVERIVSSDWNEMFAHVTPLVWQSGNALYPILVVLIFALWITRQRKPAIYLFSGALIVIACLGINKVYDGFDTVFFSRTRMFIGIPLMMATGLALADLSGFRVWHAGILLLATLSYSSIRFIEFPARMQHEVWEKGAFIVVSKTRDIESYCRYLAGIAREEHARLLVVNGGILRQVITYGCPCLEEDLPPTLQSGAGDRRTWQIREHAGRIYETVMVTATGPGLDSRLAQMPEARRAGAGDVWIITGNHLTTGALLKKLGIPLRRL